MGRKRSHGPNLKRMQQKSGSRDKRREAGKERPDLSQKQKQEW